MCATESSLNHKTSLQHVHQDNQIQTKTFLPKTYHVWKFKNHNNTNKKSHYKRQK